MNAPREGLRMKSLLLPLLHPSAFCLSPSSTGDASGEFLYAALQRAGFANQSTARHAYDGLELRDVFITAICRYAPPDNKPTLQEQANCRAFLAREFALLKHVRVVIALGHIALDGYLRLLRQAGHNIPRVKFTHGTTYSLGNALRADLLVPSQ